MDTSVNRAQFLRRGAAGSLALVAGGSVLGVVTGAAPAFGQGVSDTDIAKLAATAELLAIDFYSKAIAAKKFIGDERDYLHQARANERDHYAALAKVLGSAAPKGLSFSYPNGTFSARKRTAKVGVALETAFVGAYLGAVPVLTSNELKGVAAQIAVSEGQHLSVFSDIALGKPVGPSFPKAFSAAAATKALTPFLA